MQPRSVTIQTANEQRIHYNSSFVTAWSAGTSLYALSQLYDIQSDNSKRARKVSSFGRIKGIKDGLMVYYCYGPKNFQYRKRLLKYPIGNFSYSSPNVEYPRNEYRNFYYSFRTLVVQTSALSYLQNSCEQRVKSKFFKKLKDSEFDTAITLAEISKTRVMIAHRAAVLLNIKRFFKSFWKRVRGRSIQRHESIAQAIANAWLEYQYGWKQLANDIYGIVSFSTKKSMNRYVKVRAGCADTVNRSFVDPDTGIYVQAIEQRECRGQMKIGLNMTADPVLDMTRLSTLNPIAIAWELLPFSFVFDWMLDMSTYLSELQTRLMFDVSLGDGFFTYVHHYELQGKIAQQVGKGTFQKVSVYQDILWSDYWVETKRTLFTTAPLPSFPRLKSPVSASHALTTLSLITQRMKPKGLGRSGRFM